MARKALGSALLAVGLATAACGGSGESNSTTVTETVSATAAATSAAPTTSSAGMASLIPTPADTQRTDGPDEIQEGGVHKHFLVTGAPTDVMNAYKVALDVEGWALVMGSSGGGGGGGGATYTGTKDGTYGVFVGGGYGSTTDINSCVWPTKPSNTNCGGN